MLWPGSYEIRTLVSRWLSFICINAVYSALSLSHFGLNCPGIWIVLYFINQLEIRFFFFVFFLLLFYLAFHSKSKYFVQTDHVLSETICLFCFWVLFSNICLKIKSVAKNWSNLRNFYNKVLFFVVDFCLWVFCFFFFFFFFFFNFDWEQILLSFAELKLLMFHTTIFWKILKKMNKRNLLKICLQVIYPTNFCVICIQFYYWKKWKC